MSVKEILDEARAIDQAAYDQGLSDEALKTARTRLVELQQQSTDHATQREIQGILDQMYMAENLKNRPVE